MTFLEDFGILMIGVTNLFITYNLWVNSNKIIEMKNDMGKGFSKILGYLYLKTIGNNTMYYSIPINAHVKFQTPDVDDVNPAQTPEAPKDDNANPNP